jgi:hypothetical protein
MSACISKMEYYGCIVSCGAGPEIRERACGPGSSGSSPTAEAEARARDRLLKLQRNFNSNMNSRFWSERRARPSYPACAPADSDRTGGGISLTGFP